MKKRKDADLPVLEEDPLQIVREMKASVPPTSASDILEIAQAPRRRRGRVRLNFTPNFSKFIFITIPDYNFPRVWTS